jgi:hypothetical protein
MKTPGFVRSGAVFSLSLLALCIPSQAQVLYSDSLDSATGWTVNSGPGTANRATFGFDYSTLGIPAAPNSGGSTIGLRLEANRPGGGVNSGISVSPTGQSFTGDYQLRFDMWLNAPGAATPPGFPAGGTGSTQLTGGGIGTAGTSAQWHLGANDSVFFMGTGEGGAAQDYRVYPVGALAAPTTGYYAAGTTTTPDVRNAADPYYASFGGVTPPAEQTALFPQQNGTTQVGTLGFEWHDVAITKTGNIITWDVDGIRLATVDLTTVSTPLGGSNILLNQSDINAGTTDAAGDPLLFGLFDNVRVTQVPEPSTYALMGLGALAFAMARRRK